MPNYANRKIAISLFDLTGEMLKPWANAGFECWALDTQHKQGEPVTGPDGITRLNFDLSTGWLPPFERKEIAFVAAFPPCTGLAVSGARWFKGKGLRDLAGSIQLFATAAEFCEWSGAPYMIENPVSTISTYWRKPDHCFHPHQYAGLFAGDNYTKKTCLWVGGGFVMPDPVPGDFINPDNRIHMAPPGPERANFRSATPPGFSMAVFAANGGGLINA